jgi:hypothetical protein
LKKTDFTGLGEFQTLAWQRLIQRFDTFLKKSKNAKGIIISDDTNHPLVNRIIRQMRVYNPTPSHFSGHYSPLTNNIMEDLFTRRSEASLFIQTVDVIAHLLYRKEFPKPSLKKYNVDKFFNTIDALLLKEASTKDPQGIVRK